MNIEAKPLHVLKCGKKRNIYVSDYADGSAATSTSDPTERNYHSGAVAHRDHGDLDKYHRNGGGEAANLALK